MIDEVVTRLYRALVHELRRRGHPEDEPITVAALYEELVPYRAVRARLGVELNADYEHAILRLLAGEGGLLRLEPEDARDELRQEAASAYPDVGLFRKFSASRVWISLPGDDEEPGSAVPVEADADAVEFEAPEPEAPGRTDRTDPEQVGAASSEGGATGGSAVCPACGGALPERGSVRFCPRCGADQEGRCPECGADVQADWRFCVRCGAGLGDEA